MKPKVDMAVKKIIKGAKHLLERGVFNAGDLKIALDTAYFEGQASMMKKC